MEILRGTINIAEGQRFKLELLLENESLLVLNNNDLTIEKIVDNPPEVTYISSPHILNYLSTISSGISAREVGVDKPGVNAFYDQDLLEKLIPKTSKKLSINEFLNNYNIEFDKFSKNVKLMKESIDKTNDILKSTAENFLNSNIKSISDIESIKLQKNIENNINGVTVPIKYKDRFEILDRGRYMIPAEVGNGVKLVAMIKALNYNKLINKNSILLIDEPEDSLHTYALKKIVAMISKLSPSIVLTTHSSDLLHLITDYTRDLYLITEVEENRVVDVSHTTLKEASDSLMKEIIGEIIIDGL